MNDIIEQSIKKLTDAEGLKNVCREHERNHPMPSTDVINDIVNLLRAIFYPGYFGDSTVNPKNVGTHIKQSVSKLQELILQQIKAGICFNDAKQDYNCKMLAERAQNITDNFISQLPELREALHNDVIAAYNGDPAAKSHGEVIFCYPSIKAITNYRVAHALLSLQVPIIPRIISEMAHSETGIDIHPGATIGESFMIDHGTGVVIGETAVIGKNVKLYQGVTLGAKSFPLDEEGNPIKGIDRHPKIGNNVIIYSNSTILGNIKVGDDAIIGGNIWVDSDVPVGAKLTQKKRDEEFDENSKKTKKEKHKKRKEKAAMEMSFDVIVSPFKPCKGCSSKYGCRKCREKYEKKYGVKIDNKTL